MTTTFHEIDNTAMRILTLACATTSHALLAPHRSTAAQTVRHVKIDSNNIFFRALDGAKELALKTGDLARDAGALAQDVKARAKEAQAQPKVDVPAKKAPFKFMNAATPKKVEAAPAFDLSALTAPAKDAAKSLKAAPDALKATATGYLTAVQDTAAAVAATPEKARETLDATVARVEATAQTIASIPDNAKAAADSVGSAVAREGRGGGRRRRRGRLGRRLLVPEHSPERAAAAPAAAGETSVGATRAEKAGRDADPRRQTQHPCLGRRRGAGGQVVRNWL